VRLMLYAACRGPIDWNCASICQSNRRDRSREKFITLSGGAATWPRAGGRSNLLGTIALAFSPWSYDTSCNAKDFGKASPFRPRIARTMPHLGQCDAIATGRYMPIHL
jgi:hypothetical protein